MERQIMEKRQGILPQRLTPNGFTLIELMVVIVMIAIMAGMAVPSFVQWRQNLLYRETARDVVSILREARARAISNNRQHRVEFDIDGNQYRLTRGNSSSNSSSWTAIRGWVMLPSGVSMMRDDGCGNATDVNILFNPNGTSGVNGRICIRDATPATRYQVTITATTGRIRMS
jgi:prepilin-type N-terminal cleavage/methylation domain-containing protein